MPEISDDIDHLYEATQHVNATPANPGDHFQRAQGHALIAIAKELRRINEHNDFVSNGPRG